MKTRLHWHITDPHGELLVLRLGGMETSGSVTTQLVNSVFPNLLGVTAALT